MQAFAVHVHVL